MQITHFVSDLILVLVSIYVFFKYLIKLELGETILWEAFVLSVGAAAFFGCIHYMGYEFGNMMSMFFQDIASITGAFCLMFVAIAKVENYRIPPIVSYIILTIGFLLFAMFDIFRIQIVAQIIPQIALIMVLVMAIVAFFKGKIKLGTWLVLGVLFLFAATMKAKLFPPNADYVIDLFHYLTALGVLSFGVASSKR